MFIDFDKLRHEWKTFAWGAVSVAVEAWDNGLSEALGQGELIPEHYRPIVHVAVPLGFFFLRQWKNKVEINGAL